MIQAEVSLYRKAWKLSKSHTKSLFSPAPPVRCTAPGVWSVLVHTVISSPRWQTAALRLRGPRCFCRAGDASVGAVRQAGVLLLLPAPGPDCTLFIFIPCLMDWCTGSVLSDDFLPVPSCSKFGGFFVISEAGEHLLLFVIEHL